MKKVIQKVVLGALLLSLYVFLPSIGHSAVIIADHNARSEFTYIPDTVIEQIRNDYTFYYGHTSHGSQIMTGLSMLAAESSLYIRPSFYERNDDLGHNGDTSWVADLRTQLNTGNYNVAMMSWCGGASDNTEAGINIYLNKMNELESDYPHVIFIYMTGHLDGTGINGNLYARNNQIRGYCNAHNKILFDFADIESYDPDGNFYPDETDACNWCSTWCASASHTCPSCGSCAHSHCFNCYSKGKVFWWMMARVAGWNSGTGIEDENTGNLPQLYKLNQNYPNPFNLSTVINFSMPTASHVKLDVYDILGEKVVTLVDGFLPAGQHVINWDGLGGSGKAIASGVYFYRLNTDEFTTTKKMLLLK